MTVTWYFSFSFLAPIPTSPALWPVTQSLPPILPLEYCHPVGEISVRCCWCYGLAQFSCSVMSNSLQTHGLQHARPPCPSPAPRVYSNSCLSSRWCHPTISSSVIPFSSCLQSFQHQGLFQWVSSAHQIAKLLELQLQHQSVQGIFRTDFLWMDWLDLLAVQGTLKSLFQHHSSKASVLWGSTFFMVQLSHPYMVVECYGNVIHCLSGQYNNTALLYGHLYILLALITTVCLLAQSSMHLSQILFKLSDWTIKSILICTNLL